MQEIRGGRLLWMLVAAVLLTAGLLAGRSPMDARGALAGHSVDLEAVDPGGARTIVPARGRRGELLAGALLAAVMFGLTWRWTRLPGDYCPGCGVRRQRPGVCTACGEVPIQLNRGRIAAGMLVALAGIARAARARPALSAACGACVIGTVAMRGRFGSSGVGKNPVEDLFIVGAVSAVAFVILWRAGIRATRDAVCIVCAAPAIDTESPRCPWCGALR